MHFLRPGVAADAGDDRPGIGIGPVDAGVVDVLDRIVDALDKSLVTRLIVIIPNSQLGANRLTSIQIKVLAIHPVTLIAIILPVNIGVGVLDRGLLGGTVRFVCQRHPRSRNAPNSEQQHYGNGPGIVIPQTAHPQTLTTLSTHVQLLPTSYPNPSDICPTIAFALKCRPEKERGEASAPPLP